MRTVILGDRPRELEALIESRRATGADLYDEVWDGEYHMAPAAAGPHGELDGQLGRILGPLAGRIGMIESGPFNVGDGPTDFRVPDRGIRERSTEVWFATAALVVEIVSPDDETWEKLPFYGDHDVDEIVIADPQTQTLTWLRLDAGTYAPVRRSELLDVAVADIVAQIDWPPVDD
jgi:Uma2 family endonuclease